MDVKNSVIHVQEKFNMGNPGIARMKEGAVYLVTTVNMKPTDTANKSVLDDRMSTTVSPACWMTAISFRGTWHTSYALIADGHYQLSCEHNGWMLLTCRILQILVVPRTWFRDQCRARC
jgi:hypothetical protein